MIFNLIIHISYKRRCHFMSEYRWYSTKKWCIFICVHNHLFFLLKHFRIKYCWASFGAFVFAFERWTIQPNLFGYFLVIEARHLEAKDANGNYACRDVTNNTLSKLITKRSWLVSMWNFSWFQFCFSDHEISWQPSWASALCIKEIMKCSLFILFAHH